MTSPLSRLTAILSRAAGVPDSTVLTMGGEVELELTMGDLRALAKAVLSAQGEADELETGWDISRTRWAEMVQSLQANLARAREILKPFAAIIASGAPAQYDKIWRDDPDNWTANDHNWGKHITVAMVRAASRFLTEGEGT